MYRIDGYIHNCHKNKNLRKSFKYCFVQFLFAYIHLPEDAILEDENGCDDRHHGVACPR